VARCRQGRIGVTIKKLARTLRPRLNVTLTIAGQQVTAILETITDPGGT